MYNKSKTKNLTICLVSLAMGLYMCLKIYRNSLNNAVEAQGGIWNMVNVMYIGLAFMLVLLRKRSIRNRPACINWAFAYSCIALFFSFVNYEALNVSISVAFYLAMLFYVPCVMLVFYGYSVKGLGKNVERIITGVYLVVGMFCAYLMVIRLRGLSMIYQSDMYFLLCMMPFMMLWKKGPVMYAMVFLAAAVVVLSGKRTATLGLVGAIIVYLLLQMKLDGRSTSFFKMLLKIFAVAVVVLIMYNYLDAKYSIGLIERLENLAEDGGSGRDDIYIGLLQTIARSEPSRWFTGYGVNAVTRVYGRNSAAHNDFIEIMFDYGIFGVVAIVGFYISMIKACAAMVRDRFFGAPAFAASVVISLFMSMFSNYLITFTHVTGSAAFWGVCLALWRSGTRRKLEIVTIEKG